MSYLGGYNVSSAGGGSGGVINFTFANAADRSGAIITGADLGKISYQEDMQLFYRVVEDMSGGYRWGRLDDPRVTRHRFLPSPNNKNTSAGFFLGVGTILLTAGNFTAKDSSLGTNFATRMNRWGIRTNAAAGQLAGFIVDGSNAANNCLVPNAGFRSRVATTLEASANFRWNVAAYAAAVQNANVNPNTQVNILSMGRGAEANVQIYCNDNAGLCTQFDCGVSFPAAVSGSGYELELFVPILGAEWVAQVTNINTGDAVSTTFNSNLPLNTSGGPSWFCTNNTDAVAVEVGANYWYAEHFNFGA